MAIPIGEAPGIPAFDTESISFQPGPADVPGGPAMAAVELAVAWHSGEARHEDRRVVTRLDPGRDTLPVAIAGALREAPVGKPVSVRLAAGELTPHYDPARLLTLPAEAFKPNRPRLRGLQPRAGRFYPRGFIAGHGGVSAGDRRPMRVVAAGEGLAVDLNHPLAGREMTLTARLLAARPAAGDPDGPASDAAGLVLEGGPGLQARWRGRPTDFWSDDPFRRESRAPDGEFYQRPRLVNHLDDRALAQVRGLYGRLLPRGGRILDLMSSWTSHLEPALEPAAVTGLGMNHEELGANPVLTERVVHDLNADPRLPFADASFDAIVCTVSVEYLTRPFEVFAEAARVLAPGGRFVLTFSDRWFPPKVVKAWHDCHEFERQGLVLEYFLRDGAFTELNSWSLRGLPRPPDDKYAHQLELSDPVFAVWGTRAG